MFKRFAHYLSYGATDQETVRELLGSYAGLVVPGTVAAFQREGTGGFVLSLSATMESPEYVIDPRFPLFQQRLARPKKSHEALADLLGDPALVSDRDPLPVEFPPDRVERIAVAWLSFNRGYQSGTLGKFAKYARRLGEPVVAEQSRSPQFVLPPYAIARDVTDPWWLISKSFFQTSASHAANCVRVVAAESVGAVSGLLNEVAETRAVVWVSDFQELTMDVDALATYAGAIAAARGRGQALFALYGGFFSVLMSGFGLVGSSHGIGYGENRHWLELPRSGPPPARYYLRPVHRYVSQDLAYQLWLRSPRLVECNCRECEGAPPIALDYHSLMKHSVWSRADEIREWAPLDPTESVTRLEKEYKGFLSGVQGIQLPAVLRNQVHRSMNHMPRWIDAMRRVP